MIIAVEAYSGHKANERPLAIRLDEKRLEVVDILDRWYGEDHEYFKIKAEDGCLYIIRYDRINDLWELTLTEGDEE
ncbi:MAG: hypothetical protein OEV42_10380 [Deltaproteobacteria bacterium]|nr:hypothetical protein [Deltaproteobacteria bacterium]